MESSVHSTRYMFATLSSPAAREEERCAPFSSIQWNCCARLAVAKLLAPLFLLRLLFHRGDGIDDGLTLVRRARKGPLCDLYGLSAKIIFGLHSTR